jgi:hypothetical protein
MPRYTLLGSERTGYEPQTVHVNDRKISIPIADLPQDILLLGTLVRLSIYIQNSIFIYGHTYTTCFWLCMFGFS